MRDSFEVYRIGDEYAYAVTINGKKYFVMGSEIQTEHDFEKNIERRFGNKWNEIWMEAVGIVRQYDESILKSQRFFYETVYKPRRDQLAKRWSEIVNS